MLIENPKNYRGLVFLLMLLNPMATWSCRASSNSLVTRPVYEAHCNECACYKFLPFLCTSYFSSWFPRKDNTGTASTSRSYNTQTVLDTSPIASPGSARYNDTVTPATNYCLVFAFGAASGAGALLAWRPWGMRLSTAQWVTPNQLARRRWVCGVVTR